MGNNSLIDPYGIQWQIQGRGLGRGGGAPLTNFLDQTKARCFYGDSVHRFVMQK